jgi:uncharacterized protein YabE (DUF348 family)
VVSRHAEQAVTPARVVRLLAAGIAALVLLGGGTAWALTNRSVTLLVDGVPRTVHTHAADVAGVLAQAGVTVGPRDVVVPRPHLPVSDGGQVIVDRGRLVTAVVDGQVRTFWTTARSVDAALTDLGMREGRLVLSASRATRLPLSGMRFEVRTEKEVVLVVHGRRDTVTTYAATVGELLKERGVVLDPGDESVPAAGAALGEDAHVSRVEVAYVERRTRTVAVPLPAPVRVRTDAALMLDQKSVLTPGRAGRQVRTVEDTYADGELRSSRVLSSRVAVEPRTEVRVQGARPYPPDDTGLNWGALARCESHNNPRVVSAGGTYHGLYQFSVQTWRSVGGTGLPSEATPREQTYRAILLYKRSGAGQWPVCGKNL